MADATVWLTRVVSCTPYEALGGGSFRRLTSRANAVYAITVFFFDSCDIFEAPPIEQVRGGELDAVADQGHQL
jgi:hypothetical protein